MLRVAYLFAVYLFIAKPAYAYIDAGLGSLFLQSLVAGFFTFMVFWRNWIERVKAFMHKLSGKAKNAEPGIE